MAKITNIQTKIPITDKAETTSFEFLTHLAKNSAQEPKTFWDLYEAVGQLRDKPIGTEVELTAAQTARLKDVIQQHRYPCTEDYAVFLQSVKEVLG